MPVVYQTFQHVSGYKSAIKDYFSTMNCELGKETEKMLTNSFGGYSRKIAALKQDGQMSIVEGKQALSFKGYKFITKAAMDDNTSDYDTSILRPN